MLRLALAQMRRSPGRLAAGGVAIGLGTAFVAVTLLAGGVMTTTAYRAVTASYADADLVLEGWVMTDADVAALREVPGVAAVEPRTSLVTEVSGPDGTLWLQIDAPAADPRLEPQVVLEGRLPGPGEIALPESAAKSLGVERGESASITLTRPTDDAAGTEGTTSTLTVVGILDGSAAGLLGGPPVAMAASAEVRDWILFQQNGAPPIYGLTLVSLEPDAPAQEAKAAMHRSLAGTNPAAGDVTVRTIDEQAETRISELTSESRIFTSIGLAFAAVALLVAALVIGNTFQVLVAQRTRTLALLRCVGADRSQLRRSVIIEAVLLGTGASTAGLLLGTGLVQGALLVLAHTAPGVPLPTNVTLTPASVLVPLAVGIGVTVVAALAPARAATRVSPLAAMRPADAPTVGERSGRVRAWSAAILILVGAAGMAGGMALGGRYDVTGGLGLGVLGGAVSFVGVLLSAVFWAPRLVGLLARVLGRGGTATRLAGANSIRNPRRTAATSTALLIGVTLVVMMATGAASARTALDNRLDEQFPVDVALESMNEWGEAAALPYDLVRTVAQTDGVAGVAQLAGGQVAVSGPRGAIDALPVVGLDLAEAADVLRSSDQVAGLTDATVIVPQRVADWSGIQDGDRLILRGTSVITLQVDGETTTVEQTQGALQRVTAVVTELPSDAMVLSRPTLAKTVPAPVESRLWVRLDEGADAVAVVTRVESAASRSTESAVMVSGAAAERAAYQSVIDTLLAIVIGLLGVSVLIALVGVANTLSLSVIERRRESATLRAIGLTRRQLRASLAAEGMIIAGVGAVAGTVLGTAYGWVGARIALIGMGTTPFAVAWREVGLVMVVALVAGLVASVLPARSAVRTSPVEALAVE